MTNKVRVQFTIHPKLLVIVDESAKKDKRNRSEFICEALRLYIQKLGDQVYGNNKKS